MIGIEISTAVAATWLAAAAGASGRPAPTPPPRPSVVLVTLDTTRADRLGCYGYKDATTPVLDALARSGARFERALSPAPLTLPAHASVMTGLVPRRHGVRDNAGFRLDAKPQVLAEAFRSAGYRTAGFVSAAVLDRITGIGRGFEIFDDRVRIGDRRAFNYEERAASQVTEAALAALKGLEPPFLLWVHYYDPHLPYVPPEPFRTRHPGRPYDGEIAFVDAEAGRLLEAARARAGALIVAIAGDHGESLGEHGEDGHGVFVYQATQRVPLILAGPGIPSGSVVKGNVGLIDLAPTLLDLAGIPALRDVDGRSLLPAIRGTARVAPDYEMETWFPTFAFGWSPLRALVAGPAKYIEAPRPELYALDADPTERRDLRKDRVADAERLGRRLREMTRGDMPVPAGDDPALAEQRKRIESLGYVGGSAPDPASAIDPKDGIGWIADLDAGRKALQLGDPKDAVAPLERLLARNPDNVPALLTLGQATLAGGSPDRAEALFRRALAANPDNEVALYNIANAQSERGRTDPAARAAAKATYERVLTKNPRHVDAYLAYLALLAGERKLDATLEVFARAKAAGVQDPTIELEAGLLALLRGKPDEAREALERCIALDPGESRALEALGRIHYMRKEPALAAGYYARALEVAPSSGLAKSLGSIRLYDLGDRDGALEAFRRALALAPPGDPDREELGALVRELSSPSR